MKYFLGIDIGGTETKLGVVKNSPCSAEYTLQEYVTLPTIKGEVSSMVKTIKKSVDGLKKKYGIRHCGVAVAALVNFKNGVVLHAPNLSWVRVNLKKVLEDELKLKVVIDNDANLATLAIYHLEVKKKYQNVKNIICFTLGTGIGGGVIINGELFHGSLYSGAELGHITVDINGDKCGCGNKGCIERYIGARWFIKDIIEDIDKNNPQTILYKLTNNNLKTLSPKILYLAAEKKDKYSLIQWQRYGKLLGVVVANLVNIFSAEVVVFTGGVANAHKYFLPYLKKEVEGRVWPVLKSKNTTSPLVKNLKYYIAAGQNYGVLGAGILATKTFL